MNSLTQTIVRSAALAMIIAGLSATTRATDKSHTGDDRAYAAMLASGSVRIASIGAALKIGSPKLVVSGVAGRADVRLSDGSWLFYKTFYVDNSQARGSLVVSFTGDKVSGLKLVAPYAAVAVQAQNRIEPDGTLIASR